MTPKKLKKKSPAKAKKISAKKAPFKKKVKTKTPAPKPAAKMKPTAKMKAVPQKKAPPKKKVARTKIARGKSQSVATTSFEPAGLGARSGGQSGDLQGLSNNAEADSESVDELIQEGNSFEAEVVEGVEDAPDADEGEVHTHEVPEDDVPEEYLDKDQ